MRCGRDAVRSIGYDKPFCAEHYVAEEEERHLHSYLVNYFNADDPIIQEIMRQRPQLYERTVLRDD